MAALFHTRSAKHFAELRLRPSANARKTICNPKNFLAHHHSHSCARLLPTFRKEAENIVREQPTPPDTGPDIHSVNTPAGPCISPHPPKTFTKIPSKKRQTSVQGYSSLRNIFQICLFFLYSRGVQPTRCLNSRLK